MREHITPMISSSELITSASAHTNYLTKLLKSSERGVTPSRQAAHYTRGSFEIKRWRHFRRTIAKISPCIIQHIDFI